MATYIPSETSLGRVTLVGGGRTDGAPLWRLDGRVRRVPTGDGQSDGRTPGSHGLRSTWVRAVPRPLVSAVTAQPIDYLDPVVEEAFVSAIDEATSKVTFRIAGIALTGTLRGEQVAQLAPAAPHPKARPDGIDVPPYRLVQGALALEDGALDGLFAGTPAVTGPVWLEPNGIVLTVALKPLVPAGAAPIPTVVRLVDTSDGRPVLEAIDDPRSAVHEDAWRACLAAISRVFATTRQTAWLRAELQQAGPLPRLSWNVGFTLNKKQLRIDDGTLRLPPGVARLWLSDQPLESQVLPPRRVLQLLPAAPTITVAEGVLRLGWRSTEVTSGISYEWQHGGAERLSFEALPMVHQPAEVHARLRALHGAVPQGDDAAETGFVRERRGWIELPIRWPAQPALPDPVASELTDLASGGLLLGRRRSDLFAADATPDEVPWSLEIDVPRDYGFELEFGLAGAEGPTLTKARITLAGSAVRMTGALWIAGRRPDADDALPRVEPEPDAFIPLDMANCAAARAGDAPFVVEGLAATAPRLDSKDGWDDPDMRWKRAPSLAPGSRLRVRREKLDAQRATVRGWFRHPTLPSIQTMPITRSALLSTLPHASRALDFFDSDAAEWALLDLESLQPRLDDGSRRGFVCPDVAATSAALTLPGVEIARPTAVESLYSGHYTLPVCLEPHARAGVPVDDDHEAPATTPVVTAHDRDAYVEGVRERLRMGRLAVTAESLMFGPIEVGRKAAVHPSGLAPPRTWNATAELDDVVRFGAKLSPGGVSFEQGTTWAWAAAGDALLRGADATADLGTAGVVTLSAPADGAAGVAVVGWSLAETADGVLGTNQPAVRDGHGIAWGTTLRDDGLVKRSLRQEAGGLAGELISTASPIVLDWPGAADLRLAFTDLHVVGADKAWTAEAQKASDTALAAIWTWSLFENGATDIRPLNLAPAYVFAPAALQGVTFDAQRQHVVGCVLEGALGLGPNSRPAPNDARARVRIVLERDAKGALRVVHVEASPSNDPLEWVLESPEQFGIPSARLRARPDWQVGHGLALANPRVALRLLGSALDLAMADDGANGLTMAPPPPQPAQVLAVVDAHVALASAGLTRVTLGAQLRDGIDLIATDTGASSGVTASLSWFGNRFEVDRAMIDPVLRAFTFTWKSTEPVVVAPGVAGGRLAAASVAFCTTALADGRFPIGTLFAEVIVEAAPGSQVRCSHLLRKDADGEAAPDELRLDGRLGCLSAIAWPAIPTPAVLSADVAVDVDFGGGGRVEHAMDLLFSDHRIAGARLGWVKGTQGIQLPGDTNDPGRPAATWLLEASHRLAWASETHRIDFTAAGSAQLWSAGALAKAIDALGDAYTFTASYRGTGAAVPDFPEPGVRRVRLALAGLFDKAVAQALKALGDAWVIVGSGSFLVPDGPDANRHLHVHLPHLHVMSGASEALTRSLSVTSRSSTVQRLSRHDAMETSLRLASDTVRPLASFTQALDDAVPFTAAFGAEQVLRGSQLERGFFFRPEPGGAPAGLEVCWHVEQFRREGASSAGKPPRFPFPRAAVMLARLRSWTTPRTLDVASILVAYDPDGARSIVRTVSTARPPAAVSRERHYAIDLLVGSARRNGSARRIVRIPLEGSAGTTLTDQRALLHVVLEHVSEPAFAVLRAFAPVPEHVPIELPRAKPPAVLAANFPQRTAKGFYVLDGRRTWPERAAPSKAGLGVVMTARRHETGPGGLAIAVRGAVYPPRLALTPFPESAADAGTVWLQRQDEVAFDVGDLDVQDAAPVATAGARLVRPVVPSIRALGDALTRMDPLLSQHALQSLLSPSLSDIDRSDRAGAFSLARARVLVGVGPAGSAAASALAGPSTARWSRLPRPLPLPPNSREDPSTWRRTTGWYGAPLTSCLVRSGRWAGIQGPPASARGAPAWFLLVGAAEPQQVGSSPAGPVWRGAVRLDCTRIDGGGDAATVLLRIFETQKATASAALRHGSRRLPFEKVTLEGERLVFVPATDPWRKPIDADDACRIELSFDLPSALPAAATGTVIFGAAGRDTLQPVSHRTISIPVTPPRARAYPLPVVTRSIFFDDPEYDLALSKVEPASAYALAGGVRYQLWVDRRFMTPWETVVVQIDAESRSGAGADPGPDLGATLSAGVKRWGRSEFVELNFSVGASHQKTVVLKRREMASLPLSDLVDPDGAGPALAVGDLLRLQATFGEAPATLFFTLKRRSALPTPEAMYSLIAIDPKADARGSKAPQDVAWTALHSGCPAAESLETYQVDGTLVRRGRFRWEHTEPSRAGLRFALMKTHLPSESTHVPDEVEPDE